MPDHSFSSCFRLILVWTITLFLLPACQRSRDATLETFTKSWHEAVSQRKTETLFDMLDGDSRRRLEHDLETLRGLPPSTQRQVLNQLGGERVESFLALTPPRYFALLWNRATEGRRPTMSIDSRGEDWAYVILALNGRKQRVRLSMQGPRWVWHLPDEQLETPATRPASP